MMLFLLFAITIQLWAVNIKAQHFRVDYMWALAFKTFYRLHDLESSWDRARQICEAEGTELLVPDSMIELENLKILMSNMRAFSPGVFVGLHDRYSIGDYVNLKGQPIKDTFLDLLWVPGSQHNNTRRGNCVVMTREGLFKERSCDALYPFICKIFGNHTRFNSKCNNFDAGYAPPKTKNNGKCYKFHKEPLSWGDAHLICHEEEGQLAIPTSDEEAKMITSYLNVDEIKAPDPNIMLIGFSDLMFPYEYRTIQDFLPWGASSKMLHLLSCPWMQLKSVKGYLRKMGSRVFPCINILYCACRPACQACKNFLYVSGDSLENAGYVNWGYVKDDIDKMSKKRCGAIARTGQMLMVDCKLPAMFLCESDVNSRYANMKLNEDVDMVDMAAKEDDEDSDEDDDASDGDNEAGEHDPDKKDVDPKKE